MSDSLNAIRQCLVDIYGADTGAAAAARILPLVAAQPSPKGDGRPRFTADDVVLITYADSLRDRSERSPLDVFRRFARTHLSEVFSHIHFLPFFPYSSDDGFSVTDFHSVNPAVGSWEDIEAVGGDFDLMFDYVLNHVSAQSDWFRQYLAGHPDFQELAIAVDPDAELQQVVRPRALPLLTPFETAGGKTAHVWTTFSADQIDLNWKNVAVLERMIRVLLDYVARGAAFIRMDAVAYLWKELGTSCIHLPNTHRVVQLFRAILDVVAPQVAIITETNVPHTENISYFGDGSNEAQMVYNFTLPPLLLHAFITGQAGEFSEWIDGLMPAGEDSAFFNFTASHDGIGVRPLEGILSETAMANLVAHVTDRGGRVSEKANPTGPPSPYELNITYVDALGGLDDPALDARRFLASQSVMLALPGVPAVYIHSLLGSRNWQTGVATTGQNRTINREPLDVDDLGAELADGSHFRNRVFESFCHMIRVRRRQPAFAPNATSTVLPLDPKVFALRRSAAFQTVIAIANFSDTAVTVPVPVAAASGPWTDLIRGTRHAPGPVSIPAYGYSWIQTDPAAL